MLIVEDGRKTVALMVGGLTVVSDVKNLALPQDKARVFRFAVPLPCMPQDLQGIGAAVKSVDCRPALWNTRGMRHLVWQHQMDRADPC
jgi:hypothetical protein